VLQGGVERAYCGEDGSLAGDIEKKKRLIGAGSINN